MRSFAILLLLTGVAFAQGDVSKIPNDPLKPPRGFSDVDLNKWRDVCAERRRLEVKGDVKFAPEFVMARCVGVEAEWARRQAIK